MTKAEYIQLLGSVKRLISNRRENPIHIDLGGVINIYITDKTQVKLKTKNRTESFNLEECNSNLLVFIRSGLNNPHMLKHLKVSILDHEILSIFKNNI